MSFSDFIETNIEQLLQTWEEFARKAQPDRVDLDRRQLRDWADQLLLAIATEMKSPRSGAELERKSRRLRPADDPAITEAAHVHAMDRLAQGFNINQMISEYRSMRTSAALLWQQEIAREDNELEELVRFDEAMDQALAESVRRYAQALDRARDLFVAALGHDMRSPLGSILVSAEALLLEADELDGKQVQSAVRIRNAARRIDEMLKDLVDFTQAKLGGRLPISRERADVANLLARIAEEQRTLNPQRDIVLDCEPGLHGWFDVDRIEQMVSNLLSNACKYGKQETPVRLTARQDGETIVISVHNDGDPVPEALRRTMFEPFVRGQEQHPAGERQGDRGLGLGLYISRQIAESHGGELTLNSTREGGTTFEAHLPRSSDESD